MLMWALLGSLRDDAESAEAGWACPGRVADEAVLAGEFRLLPAKDFWLDSLLSVGLHDNSNRKHHSRDVQSERLTQR